MKSVIDYQNQFYTPSLDRSTQWSDNEYHGFRQSVSQQNTLKELWPGIHFVSCSTSADTQKRLLDNEIIEAKCQIDLGQATRDMVTVEMYYQFGDQQYTVTPLTFQHQEASIASYTGSLKLHGFGKQRMNVRVRPTNDVLQDLNPGWIKWA